MENTFPQTPGIVLYQLFKSKWILFMFSLLKLVSESSICEIHIGTKKLATQQQREFMLALVKSTYNLGTFCL